MDFSELLEKYISELDCTSLELSEASGVSQPVLSRCRKGTRIPKPDSALLVKLSHGIAEMSKEKGIAIAEDEVFAKMQENCTPKAMAGTVLGENFNTLVSKLNISLTALADFSSFNLSYLYRIRSGERKPHKADKLRESLCKYIARYHDSETEKQILTRLTGQTITDDNSLYDVLMDWLCHDHSGEMKPETAEHFLTNLDDFDLNEFIRAISFGQTEMPAVQPEMPQARRYFGIEEFKQAELDFFTSVLLSDSVDHVKLCSDMPMSDMAVDLEFGKKWMMGLALLMKKGVRLEIIHDLDRPFDEMMYGLESWIPLYMTGQVSPYYFKSVRNGIYRHLLYSAKHSALHAECLSGFHEDGRYDFVTDERDVLYCQKRAKELFQKAAPLMDIYREDTAAAFRKFEDKESGHSGKRRHILSVPPIYTISDELLNKILDRCEVSAVRRISITQYVTQQRANMEKILTHSPVTIELPELTAEEFEEYPAALSLAGMFYPDELMYTFDEYQEHFRMTEEYSEKHEQYTLVRSPKAAFRNIQIRMLNGSYVLITKNKHPMIQFVIRHRSLCTAIESFEITMPDDEDTAEKQA